jgi:hypothetical protein
VNVDDVDIVRAAALSEKAGAQGRCHVSAANEGQCEFFSHKRIIVRFSSLNRVCGN